MKVQILSDLHLEHSNIDLKINSDINVLILAGDISADFTLLDFLLNKVPSTTQVLYVLGNHEYETRVFQETVPFLREILSIYPNVRILDNESVVINNVKFIGSTLWSNFEGSGINNKPLVKELVAKAQIPDFNTIYMRQENNKLIKFNIELMEKEFQKAYDFIEYELKKNYFDGQKMVITHFAPHEKSVARLFKNNLLNSYWVNNLPELMGFCDYWVHGHTHTSFNYDIEGTTVLCNPRGYSKIYDQSQNLNFDKNFVIEFPILEARNNSKNFYPNKP